MNEELIWIEYISLILRKWYFIGLTVLVFGVGAVIYALTLPNVYRADAVILPLGESQSSRMGAGFSSSQIGQLSFLSGVVHPSSRLLVLLNSKTFAERVIRKLNLDKIYFKDLWDDENKKWKVNSPVDEPPIEASTGIFQGQVFFEENIKSKVINIRVEMQDPQLSATVANMVLDELQLFINESEFTDSKKHRVFIEGRLIENRRKLLEAGKELADYYGGGQKSFSTSSRLDVSLNIEELQIEEPKTYSTLSDPILQSQFQSIKEQKEKMDALLKKQTVVAEVPQQIYLEYLIQRREVLKAIDTLLSQQFEMAKIEETKEDVSFQVIDPARVPLGHFKPQRKKIVMFAFALSFFLSVFVIFFVEYIKKARLQISPHK